MTDVPNEPRPVITVAAALIVHPDGRILLVRKRGTTKWMQAGGKPEPGETAVETIVRELAEELELAVAPGDLEPLGRFTTTAANEPGHELRADVFRLVTDAPIRASAEIAEAVWRTPEESRRMPLAPLAMDLLRFVQPAPMFDTDFRDRVSSSILDIVSRDSRVTAGAVVGSLALTDGDRFSDIDLTFAIHDGAALQSRRPERDMAGYAVHHVLHARTSLERGRWLQSAYWIGELRNEALEIALSRAGLEPSQARGAHLLPEAFSEAVERTLPGSLEQAELRRALAASVSLLRLATDGSDLLPPRVSAQLDALAAVNGV